MEEEEEEEDFNVFVNALDAKCAPTSSTPPGPTDGKAFFLLPTSTMYTPIRI
jgi:hypothetical protein